MFVGLEARWQGLSVRPWLWGLCPLSERSRAAVTLVFRVDFSLYLFLGKDYFPLCVHIAVEYYLLFKVGTVLSIVSRGVVSLWTVSTFRPLLYQPPDFGCLWNDFWSSREWLFIIYRARGSLWAFWSVGLTKKLGSYCPYWLAAVALRWEHPRLLGRTEDGSAAHSLRPRFFGPIRQVELTLVSVFSCLLVPIHVPLTLSLPRHFHGCLKTQFWITFILFFELCSLNLWSASAFPVQQLQVCVLWDPELHLVVAAAAVEWPRVHVPSSC